MSGLHNLKPDRVVKAFERAGWTAERQKKSLLYRLTLVDHSGGVFEIVSVASVNRPARANGFESRLRHHGFLLTQQLSPQKMPDIVC